MNKLSSLAFAAVLATTGTAAFAEQSNDPKAPVGPVAMTEAQMDNVTAGAPLINVEDVLDIGNVQVAVPVNAGVAVAALGATATAVPVQLGRVRQAN